MADILLYAELYDNPLTEKEGDFTAKPKVTGTIRNADIAKRIVEKRTEYRPETIENSAAARSRKYPPSGRRRKGDSHC